MKLAIFDFNGTIFYKETLPFLLQQWYKNNYSRRKLLKVLLPLLPLYFNYKIGLNSSMTKEEMERKAVHKFSQIFCGMKQNQIEQFFIRAAISARKYYNQPVITEISRVNNMNYHTVLLSGAFKPLLSEIGDDLNIKTVIGSEFEFKQGQYDDTCSLEIVSGGKKLKKLKDTFSNNKINWKQSCAYADSYHDLEILMAVGEPIAVNPDNKLLEAAQKRDWTIITIAR
jgi:HAD superfamily phosphoserine phosphatase-like hydrolase